MLGQRIREIRKQKKLTQEKLAEGIITRSYLSQIEKGTVQPSYDVLEKLGHKLECNIEDFFKHTENKNLLISEIKKEIKIIENHVEANSWDKVENFVVNKHTFEHPSIINDYDKGILNWIHGKYYEHTGDFASAITYYQESINCLEKTKKFNDIFRSLDSLGYVYSRINNNEKALSILRKAYKIMIHEQISSVLRISLLVNIGIIYGKLSEYYSALHFLEDARELNKKIDALYKAGQIFMALGVCYTELKRYDEAKQSYEQALNLFKLNKQNLNEAGTYTNLGILANYQKRYDEAIILLTTAINLYTDLNASKNDIMNAQVELAKSYFSQKEYHSAESICHLVINQENNRYSAQALIVLGDIQLQLGAYENALNYYIEANTIILTVAEQKKLYKKIADVYFTLKNFECSSYYYQKS